MKGNVRRSSLSWSLYVVGLLQLVVAGLAIAAVHRLLQRAPFEHEPARARGLVLAFGEMLDTPDVLGRALGRLTAEHMVEMTFYRLDGTRVASTEPALPPLPPPDLERLQLEGAMQLSAALDSGTAVAITHDGATVGYGLMRVRRHAEGRPLHEGLHDPARLEGSPHSPRSDASPHSGGPPRLHHPPGPPTPTSLVISAINEPVGIAAALFAAAAIAFLFARSLARPLAQLAHAAAAFGGGDLTARANLRRSDEIGAVARTFDEMAERVNALIRRQRELLANVSHELRTPLARIRVALDIAAEGDLEAARQSLADIALDWTDLDRLIESLLTLARLDLSTEPTLPAAALTQEPLDAVSLAERAAAGFRGLHPGRALAFAPEDDAIPLVADGGMLRRVLDNLLTNAAKYSDAGAPVRLTVRRAGDDVEFAVADRGIGIDAADIPHLFEPFFRTDRTRTRSTGGVGLGLALAKRIVDAHGGRISVDSRVGAGTTIAFTIPATPHS
jgi:two-component system, OmpR family, sensor kinase